MILHNRAVEEHTARHHGPHVFPMPQPARYSHNVTLDLDNPESLFYIPSPRFLPSREVQLSLVCGIRNTLHKERLFRIDTVSEPLRLVASDTVDLVLRRPWLVPT